MCESVIKFCPNGDRIKLPDGVKAGRRETFTCPSCSTDFATPFHLETHYMKEHTSFPPAPPEPLVLDLSTKNSPKQLQQSPLFHHQMQQKPLKRLSSAPSSPLELSQNGISGGVDLESFCIKCNREYCSKYFLRTHLKKVHGISTEEYLMDVQENHPEIWRKYVTNGGGNGENGDRDVRKNWCRHCKKDFCNKYFFKTHMMKMHSEEVKEFAAVGRGNRRRSTSVACDICNKALCSKYFLKIHKKNAHGIIDPTLPANLSDGHSNEVPLEDMETERNGNDDGPSDDESPSQVSPVNGSFRNFAEDYDHFVQNGTEAGERKKDVPEMETMQSRNGPYINHEMLREFAARRQISVPNGFAPHWQIQANEFPRNEENGAVCMVLKRNVEANGESGQPNVDDNRRSPSVKQE